MPEKIQPRAPETGSELAEAVRKLADSLTDASGTPEPPHPALDYLNRLRASMARAASLETIAGEMAALERFWLEQVNWCDPLSKALEKIVVLHAQMQEEARDAK